MTTKAGLVGLLTGLSVILALVYPLVIGQPKPWSGILVTAAAMLLVGGYLAGRWGGSAEPGRCAALGALAGGVAGTLIFCWIGAASAGLTAMPLVKGAHVRLEAISAIVSQTEASFLLCFLGGIGLGMPGGWLACPRRIRLTSDRFDKSAPQMALNASITAVLASVVAAGAAAAIFSHLPEPTDGPVPDMPLAVALLLVLVSHFALTLVVAQEARQAEHRCGMDEVKMAAYVGIGAAPVLALLLFLIDKALFLELTVILALVASTGMSLKLLQTLLRLILPERAAFPAALDEQQNIQEKLFGTIADSRGSRLVVLCVGCGLIMILPLQVTVFSVLINLTSLLAASSYSPIAAEKISYNLFITQFLVSGGLMTAASASLVCIYLFYLNLGRWFRKWGARK